MGRPGHAPASGVEEQEKLGDLWGTLPKEATVDCITLANHLSSPLGFPLQLPGLVYFGRL